MRNERRRIEITTPTHGMALSAYLLAVILGATQLFGVSTSGAMVEFLGRWGALAWSMSLTVSSALALSSSLSAERRHGTGLRIALRAEFLAVTGIGFCLFLYLVALVLVTWPNLNEVLVTKLMAAAYVAGGTTRGIQIMRELRRLRHWKD